VQVDDEIMFLEREREEEEEEEESFMMVKPFLTRLSTLYQL
jgi:hypothetical protein